MTRDASTRASFLPDRPFYNFCVVQDRLAADFDALKLGKGGSGESAQSMVTTQRAN